LKPILLQLIPIKKMSLNKASFADFSGLFDISWQSAHDRIINLSSQLLVIDDLTALCSQIRTKKKFKSVA
jgi:hypothetical protein